MATQPPQPATATVRRRPAADPDVATIGLIVLSVIYLTPFVWMVSTSLKTAAQAIASPPVADPRTRSCGSTFPDAFVAHELPAGALNTLLYAVPSVIGTLVSCSLVAYGFAIIKWPGRNIVFVLVLATMMLPRQVTLIPLYVIFAKLGWTNTYPCRCFFSSLRLVVGAFFIFLLRQFFLGIPKDLVDAARVDGASELRILFQIVMPLSMPAIITVCLLTFIDKWNDFQGPLIYIQEPDAVPAAPAPRRCSRRRTSRTGRRRWPRPCSSPAARHSLLLRPAQIHRRDHAHRQKG